MAQPATTARNNAPRNRTITLSDEEKSAFKKQLLRLHAPTDFEQIKNKIIQQDIFEVLDFLPAHFVDTAFIDPPYNMEKTFNQYTFKKMDAQRYEEWLDAWLSKICRLLKPTASIYVCADWRTSMLLCNVLQKYFIVQNRITFEREKGRGAKNNWKNCSEDIWFCTVSKNYYFDVDAVKMKRKVIAPYRDADGQAKDWQDGAQKYRMTYPSNVWTDITIPFWSMPENTEHPTQKPEKLLAKIILASSKLGDTIFDPFAGSCTSAVVAKKLGRNYVAVEMDERYCCLGEKRLAQAQHDNAIQGYAEGVFWERNTLPPQRKTDITQHAISFL